MGTLSNPLIACDNRLANGRGMTDCEVVGISGGCGETCPVWLRGDCEMGTPDGWNEEPADGDQLLLFELGENNVA